MSGQSEGDEGLRAEQGEGRRRPRRARRAAPAGSDPQPYDPPLETRPEGENDERLRADVPPHWDQGA